MALVVDVYTVIVVLYDFAFTIIINHDTTIIK